VAAAMVALPIRCAPALAASADKTRPLP
jgi:hypothetical protein